MLSNFIDKGSSSFVILSFDMKSGEPEAYM